MLSSSCRPVVVNESITLSEAEPPVHTTPTPTPGERKKEREGVEKGGCGSTWC